MTTVRAGLIQFALNTSTDESPETIKANMTEAHLPLIDEAGANGVQVLCLQEVFNQPYFCPSQDVKWYAAVEKIPDGPTTRLMQEYAKKHSMVIVVPIYEEQHDRRVLQHGRRHRCGRQVSRQVPQDPYPAGGPGLLREVLLQTGRSSGYPVFETAYRQTRRLHLLRPPFPGRMARARAQRRRVHRQSVSHGRRAQSKYLWEARTTGLGRRPTASIIGAMQSRRQGRALGELARHGGILRFELHRQPVRGHSSAQASYGRRTSCSVHEIDHRYGARGPRYLWQFFRDRRPETYAVISSGEH